MKTIQFALPRIWLCTLALLSTAFVPSCQGARTPTGESQVERLITIGGPVTETVFALGRGDAVVAVDTSSVFPAQAVQRPKIGYQRTISAEGILTLRPSRVIAAEETGPPTAVAQLRSAGIPIDIIPSENSVEGARRKIALIAKLLAVPGRGAQLIAQLDEEVQQALAQSVEHAPRVLFLYARGAGTMQVAGAGTGADAMIKLAGGENAAAELSGYKPLSAESLLSARPDVLLLTSRGAESLGGVPAIKLLPGLSALPVARHPRVLTLDDLLLLGFGPRTGQAVRELRTKLAAAAPEALATAVVQR